MLYILRVPSRAATFRKPACGLCVCGPSSSRLATTIPVWQNVEAQEGLRMLALIRAEAAIQVAGAPFPVDREAFDRQLSGYRDHNPLLAGHPHCCCATRERLWLMQGCCSIHKRYLLHAWVLILDHIADRLYLYEEVKLCRATRRIEYHIPVGSFAFEQCLCLRLSAGKSDWPSSRHLIADK